MTVLSDENLADEPLRGDSGSADMDIGGKFEGMQEEEEEEEEEVRHQEGQAVGQGTGHTRINPKSHRYSTSIESSADFHLS